MSIPGVLDAQILGDGAPELLIEVPHGATDTADFTDLAAQLQSPLPEGLVEFFHVNTDVGAPELAAAIARALAPRTVEILRCRIPRTFIDCNRRVDASAADFKAGKVTPGLMPWIVTPEDRALLRGRYDAYVAAVAAARARLAPGGAMLLLHSYAPRTVDVEVDDAIVASLRRAYQPDVEPTWPLRPALDLISRDADGTDHAPPGLLDALRAALAPLEIAASATYPLHPSTLAWDHAMALPGRVACLEVRRDLVADPFVPMQPVTIGAAKVAALAGPIARALGVLWPHSSIV